VERERPVHLFRSACTAGVFESSKSGKFPLLPLFKRAIAPPLVASFSRANGTMWDTTAAASWMSGRGVPALGEYNRAM